MITITEALAAEHRIFLRVFHHIQQTLPEIATRAEAQRMAKLVEELLSEHADTEENLVYVALDHALADRGKLTKLHQEHQEIDDHLAKVHAAKSLPEARRHLKTAIFSSYAHFKSEESFVFPMIEKVLHRETLQEMAKSWEQKLKAS